MVSFSGLDVIVVEKNESIINITQEETYSRTSKQVTWRKAWLQMYLQRRWRLTHLTFRLHHRLPSNFKSICCHSTHPSSMRQIGHLSDNIIDLFYKNFKNQVVVGWGFSKTRHFFHTSKSKKRNLALYFPKPTTLVQLRLKKFQ